MRKLTLVLTCIALMACNRDRVETATPDSGANRKVVPTATAGTAIPDATATDVTLPIGGTPADAAAVTESMHEATATSTTATTATSPTATAPPPSPPKH